MERYTPPQQKIWQGRADSPADSALFQHIQLLDLNNEPSPAEVPESQQQFALLGFCCDEGVKRNLGRVGAVAGPDAIKQQLGKFAVHSNDVSLFDAGNIVCDDKNLEAAQTAFAANIEKLLAQNIMPIGLGGGHEIAWAHYQGIEKTLDGKRLGIINFDAHFDLRKTNDLGSSGTPFWQIAQHCQANNTDFNYLCLGIQPSSNSSELFKTADDLNVTYRLAEDMQFETHASTQEILLNFIESVDNLYLTFCLDVMSAAIAPGVSAAQPLGLMPEHVLPLLDTIKQSNKLISVDIAELNPKFDIDSRTAKFAAALVYRLVSHDF